MDDFLTVEPDVAIVAGLGTCIEFCDVKSMLDNEGLFTERCNMDNKVNCIILAYWLLSSSRH